MTFQSWVSEKVVLCDACLLSKKGFDFVLARFFFKPLALTDNTFVASCAINTVKPGFSKLFEKHKNV